MNDDEFQNHPRPMPASALESPGKTVGTSQGVTALAMRARAAWSSQDKIGEQRAFTDLMAAVEGQLLTYARARIDPADVEDVVAETLVRFLLQVRSDARISNALSLLFTILKNRIVDRLRRKKLVESVSDDELLSLQAARFAPVPGADDEAISRIELNRILAQVPEPERVVLYLRHVYDLSVQEVATRTGLSVDQVKKRTAEGVRHLKEVIYR